MPKRSYQQSCALALALDVIGERWSLLIIRELLTGPKRFKQLHSALAGMGTNLLAARLKELENNELICQCLSDSGSAYKEYDLTENGRQLEATILQLARWGFRYRDRTTDTYLSQPHWDMVGLKAAFQASAAVGINEVYELNNDGFVFHAEVNDGKINVRPGPAEKAALSLKFDNQVLRAIRKGETDWQSAIEQNKIVVTGNKRAFVRMQKLFLL